MEVYNGRGNCRFTSASTVTSVIKNEEEEEGEDPLEWDASRDVPVHEDANEREFQKFSLDILQ